MSNIQSDLAALIGSRICHDLISPIGAIGNGLELVSMSTGGVTPEIALINESVASANARIRFYRIAFGAARLDANETVERNEINEILDGITQGGRMRIAWEHSGPAARQDVKLIFLLLQCCETAMAYGGTVNVRQIGSSWEVNATADKLKINPALWEGLTSDIQPDVTPAQVQFALAPIWLAQTGKDLRLQMTEKSISMRV